MRTVRAAVFVERVSSGLEKRQTFWRWDLRHLRQNRHLPPPLLRRLRRLLLLRRPARPRDASTFLLLAPLLLEAPEACFLLRVHQVDCVHREPRERVCASNRATERDSTHTLFRKARDAHN